MPPPSPDDLRTLSTHLDKALGMTEEERSNWFTSLRTWNRALVEQLEQLIENHPSLAGETLLEARAAGLPGKSDMAGQTLGVYTLISQIGQGGMGSVWLAERNDARFERKVAIKFLNIALIGMAGEERFRREGMILGRLAHPNIAELIDAGISSGGQPYLVLEHIEGDHIDNYCDRHSLGVEARLRLFLDVLQAIAHAHSNMIVHRDLKPSNILVRNDGQVKLLDFGIAKLLEDEGQRETTLTVEGGRPMTPEYASPEQLTGGAVTTATDVYALGVLLYVLLTGFHPAGPSAHTHADLFKFILDTEPTRPSDAVASNLRSVEPAITNAARRTTTPDKLSRMLRGDLDTIVVTAMKKNPQERYASVSNLADDLQRYLRHEPISARPDTVPYRAVKFIRRHRGRVAMALVATAALIGATIITWTLSRRSEALPQIQQRRLTAASEEMRVLQSAISPDGKYLGFGNQQGIQLQLIETGAMQSVPLPPGVEPGSAYWQFEDWYPDSARFIASLTPSGGSVSLWSVPLSGQGLTKLAEIQDRAADVKLSPDGSTIAFGKVRSAFAAREIWLMGSQGESPRRILSADDRSSFRDIVWAPSGKRIAYNYTRRLGDRTDVSAQSCDLGGESKTTIVQDAKLSSMIWLPSGRFIYARIGDRGAAESDNLWELKVDDNSGNPRGKPRRLTDWSGFWIYLLSATKDGKQLAFLKGNEHAAVFAGDLSANGSRLVNTRRLTNDGNINILLAWTPDSREVVFSAQRAATRTLYRETLDRSSTTPLVTTATEMSFYLARLSPDKAWMLLEGEPKGSRKFAIYRVAATGGVPQLLFPLGEFNMFSCTNKTANFCVNGRSVPDRNELVLSSFDADGTNRKELMRIPIKPTGDIRLDYVWQPSPDGSWIALLKRHENQIKLLPLNGAKAVVVTVKGYSDLTDLNWAMDSKSMFVSALEPSGATLLRVDLKGAAQPLWHQSQTTYIWGIPSPDERHLAIMGSSSEANAWMISNF